MACGLDHRPFDESAAHDHAAQLRADGAQFAEVFRCPLPSGDENHWHVATRPDDPTLPQVRAWDEQRRRSDVMRDSERNI